MVSLIFLSSDGSDKPKFFPLDKHTTTFFRGQKKAWTMDRYKTVRNKASWSSPSLPSSKSSVSVSSGRSETMAPPSPSSSATVSSPSPASASASPQFFRAKDLKVKPGLKATPKLQPHQQHELLVRSKSSDPRLASSSSPNSVSSPVSSSAASVPTPPNNDRDAFVTTRKVQVRSRVNLRPFSGASESSELTDQYKQAKQQVARLDRKVMDLEISNASLLSVNKYLEKRLRNRAYGIYDSTYDKEEGLGEEEEEEEDDYDQPPSVRELLKQDGEIDEELIDQRTSIIQNRMSSHISFLETNQQIESMLHRCLGASDSLIEMTSNALKYSVDPNEIRIGGKVDYSRHDQNDEEQDSDNQDEEEQDDEHIEQELEDDRGGNA